MSESKTSWGMREWAGLVGLALLVWCLVRALMHLRDLSEIYHLAGVWLALADYLNRGTFYPPVDIDGFYAGTRYMPLFFFLIAGLARLVGDYLVAAKLAALISASLLLAGLFLAVRRATGRLADSFALTAMLLAFPEGLSTLMSPHADGLAAALALWGLLLLDRPEASVRRVSVAAFLFALSLAAKFSSVAGPAVGVVVLWQKGQQRLAFLLAGLFGLLVGLEVLGIEWLSDRRFLDQFFNLGSGGMTAQSMSIGPARLGHALLQVSPFFLVWPVALFLLLQRGPGRPVSLWEWYLLATLAVTLVIFTSPGTSYNHLLEFEVACILVLAGSGGQTAPEGRPAWQVRVRQGAAPGGSASGFVARGQPLVAHRRPWWRVAAQGNESAISTQTLADAFPHPEKLFCEDPSVSVLLGQRPVVMEPFSYRILVEQGRIDDRLLAERILEQEFDALVMVFRIDDQRESLCPRFHYGPRVTKAMLDKYRFAGEVGRYQVFRPVRSAPARLP